MSNELCEYDVESAGKVFKSGVGGGGLGFEYYSRIKHCSTSHHDLQKERSLDRLRKTYLQAAKLDEKIVSDSKPATAHLRFAENK